MARPSTRRTRKSTAPEKTSTCSHQGDRLATLRAALALPSGSAVDEIAAACEFARLHTALRGEAARLLVQGWLRVAADRFRDGPALGAYRCLARAFECFEAEATDRDGAKELLALIERAISRRRRFEENDDSLAILIEPLSHHGDRWIRALPAGGRFRRRAFLISRRLLLETRSWEVLAQLMERAGDLDIFDPWLVDAHAEALSALDEEEQALRVLEAARRRGPDAWPLARRHGLLLERAGDEDAALAALEAACVLGKTPWPWRDLARFLQRRGRSEQALRCLRAALHTAIRVPPRLRWRLHFELARDEWDSGDEPAAREESTLAEEVRRQAGWGAGDELSEFRRALGDAWDWPNAQSQACRSEIHATAYATCMAAWGALHGRPETRTVAGFLRRGRHEDQGASRDGLAHHDPEGATS